MDASLVVLAAGEGRRAGGPKAWREVRGRPWLQVQLEALAPLGLSPAVVVLSAQPTPQQAHLFGPARWAVNPLSQLGPFSSIQIGLRALGDLGTPIFVLPVDVPAPDPATFRVLWEALGGAPAAVPEYQGRGGHPVLLAARSREEILRVDPALPTSRLDMWLRSKAGEVARVECDDERVVKDLNSPEDFEG